MKVAYIFATTGHTVSYKLGRMILPQLEENRHGVEVVGIFFEDNTYLLQGRPDWRAAGEGGPGEEHPADVL